MPFLYQKSTIKQLFFLIHYFPGKFRCVEKHAAAMLAQIFFVFFLNYTVIRLLVNPDACKTKTSSLINGTKIQKARGHRAKSVHNQLCQH